MKFYANRLDRIVLTATLTVLTAAALGKITGVVSVSQWRTQPT